MTRLCNTVRFLQLDIITRTISILENRLTLTEDRMSTIIAYTRGLGEVPTSNPSHAKTSAYLEFERTERTDRENFAPTGPTISNSNPQAASGTKHYNSQLFDDRSYDEIHSSNFLRNEDSFLKNVPRNDVSSIRNMLRPNEPFAKIVTRNDDSPVKNVLQHDASSPRNVAKGSGWMRSSSLREMQPEDECVREEKRQSSGENLGFYYSDNDYFDMPYVGKKSPAFPRRPVQVRSFHDEDMVEEEEEGQREEQLVEEQEVGGKEHNSVSYDDKDVDVEDEVDDEVEVEDEGEDDQDEPLEVGEYADSESGDEYYTQEGEDQQADDDGGVENTYEVQDKDTSAVRGDVDSDALVEAR